MEEEEEELFLLTAYRFLSEISYGRESAPDLRFPHVPTGNKAKVSSTKLSMV
jgi:hypothetical protein